MGKLLVKWGLWIQFQYNRMKCGWNGFVSKFMFKVEDACPNKVCTCKK